MNTHNTESVNICRKLVPQKHGKLNTELKGERTIVNGAHTHKIKINVVSVYHNAREIVL